VQRGTGYFADWHQVLKRVHRLRLRRLLDRCLSKPLIQRAKKITWPLWAAPYAFIDERNVVAGRHPGTGPVRASMLSAQQHRRPQVRTPLFACVRARASPLRRAAEPRPPMLLQSGVRARPAQRGVYDRRVAVQLTESTARSGNSK
jgi:hypothetical protein